ncbi:unnamed protein product [Polarella glacialis]|uniref:Sister chromatid cohesion protein n=1 Tax=Polarella glacialis TaxID=89957 RepID=A0A813LS98_POLGL|nr:unnamed protein product [Polarella glacialis]
MGPPAADAARPPKQRRKAAVNQGSGCTSEAPTAQASLLEGLVRELESGCRVALRAGLGTSELPGAVAARAAHLVWELKMSTWGPDLRKGSAQDLGPLSILDGVLEEVFKALDGQCLTLGGQSGKQSDFDVKLRNAGAGLTLAALVLDLCAFLHLPREGDRAPAGPRFAPGEAVVTAAIGFLWQQARLGIPAFLESSSGTRSSPQTSESPTTSTAKLLEGLARALRSLHHVLAARRFLPGALPAVSVAHRAAPLATQCLMLMALPCCPAACKNALAILGAAAGDLLAALAGQGEAALQATAVEELGKLAASSGLLVCGAAKAQRGSGGSVAAGPFLSSALRAVGAACLPVRLPPTADMDTLAAAATVRGAAAEARAGVLAAALLQKTLLEVPSGLQAKAGTGMAGASADGACLEACFLQLTAACGDPHWAGAPLLTLRLISALARIAGASRGVDLDCARRELATKLLSVCAEALCSQRAEATAASCKTCRSCGTAEASAEGGCDICALRRWTAAAGVPLANGQAGGPKECLMQLLITYLQHQDGSENTGLVAPASAAGLAACNSAALLCLFAAGPLTPAAGAKPARRSKSAATKAGSRSKPKEAIADSNAEVPCWALKSWAALARLSAQQSQVGGAAAAVSGAAGRFAARLYRRMQWRDSGSTLSRARTSALEALLGLARGSPLAHVRRQAMVGLAAACQAEPELLASRCVAEAVAWGLQDDSALARLASVEMVARLAVSAGSAPTERLVELRTAARTRLSDPSPLVRRAAFRAACDWLEATGAPKDEAALLEGASDLLLRLRHEPVQLRSPVLATLERVLLRGQVGSRAPDTRTVMSRLTALLVKPGVGSHGVRDLLAAHCRALEGINSNNNHSGAADVSSAATSAMDTLAAAALGHLPSSSDSAMSNHNNNSDHAVWASLVEQVSAERPAALHGHIRQLQAWLKITKLQAGSIDAVKDSLALVLPAAACRVLSNMLPSWAALATTAARKQTADELRHQLAVLLDSTSAPAGDLGGVARAAVECLAVTAAHLSQTANEPLLGYFGRGVRLLHEAAERQEAFDMNAQRDLCRHAWIVGSILEFLDSDSMQAVGSGSVSGSSGGSDEQAAEAGVWLLSSLCLHGPAATRPAMLPALGFALRRFPQLLRPYDGSEGGGGGPLEALRRGLSAAGAGPAALAMRAQAVETLGGLLAVYQKAAEADDRAPPKATEASGGATSLASEAAQRLATLQPELLQALCSSSSSAAAESCAQQVLRGLRGMSEMGVLHPASALPGLLAAAMAAARPVAVPAGRVVLRLVGAAPPLLASRLGPGLRAAAELLCTLPPAEVSKDAYRFASWCEAYAEHLSDSRQLRDHFLDALMAEVLTLASEASPADTGVGGRSPLLARAELLFGLLPRLPMRKEAELARLLRGAVQFLSLRAFPVLPDGDISGSPKKQMPAPTLGLCAAAVLLHQLACHWLQGGTAEFGARLLEAVAAGFTPGLPCLASLDQPLPAGFSRRPVPDLSNSRRWQVMELSAFMAKHLPVDSPLLNRGSSTTAGRSNGPAAGRGIKAAAEITPTKVDGKRPRVSPTKVEGSASKATPAVNSAPGAPTKKRRRKCDTDMGPAVVGGA